MCYRTVGGTVVKACSSRSSCGSTKPLLSLQSVSIAPVYFVVSILPSTVLLLDFPYLFKLYEHSLPCHVSARSYTFPQNVCSLCLMNGSYVYEVHFCLFVVELSLDCTGLICCVSAADCCMDVFWCKIEMELHHGGKIKSPVALSLLDETSVHGCVRHQCRSGV